MFRPRWLAALVPAGMVATAFFLSGCVNLKAPEEINIGSGRHQPVDASQVPPTKTHEEARQKLAEAYTEIRYLQSKVADLEKDKKELKAEREEWEKKYKKLKDKKGD
jgi:outer membrane murein-binding lipoprotein Lpp